MLYRTAAATAAAVLFLLATSIPTSVVDAACTKTVVRQEIRQLSESQRNAFFNAVKQIQSGGKPTEYDRLVLIHFSVRDIAHGYAPFFAWHRAYLREFELALQRKDPSVVLPYWDWSYDSQAPSLSPIFHSTWFGGNGDPKDYCVTDGQFSEWRPQYPQSHCLQRHWEGGDSLTALYAPELIAAVLRNSNTYSDLRQQFEPVPHALVHSNINGDMLTMYGPNDPIFFVHHSFVDKIWADWQSISPHHANSYGGINADGSRANVNDRLARFKYKVKDVLDTKNLCYTYGKAPSDIDISNLPLGDNIKAPNPNETTTTVKPSLCEIQNTSTPEENGNESTLTPGENGTLPTLNTTTTIVPASGNDGTSSTGGSNAPSTTNNTTPSTNGYGNNNAANPVTTPATNGTVSTPATNDTTTPTTSNTTTPTTSNTTAPTTNNTTTPTTNNTTAPTTNDTTAPTANYTATTPATEVTTTTPATEVTATTPATEVTVTTPATNNTGTTPTTNETTTPATNNTATTPTTNNTTTPTTNGDTTPATNGATTPTTNDTASTPATLQPSVGTITIPPSVSVTPPPDDKTELVAIRNTKPVSDGWLVDNNENIPFAREVEKYLRAVTEQLNRNPNFISIASLARREDLLAKSIVQRPQNNYSITTGDRATHIDLTKNNAPTTREGPATLNVVIKQIFISVGSINQKLAQSLNLDYQDTSKYQKYINSSAYAFPSQNTAQ